jgi:RimJ/RimL family protein N-acetyltransferase/predicted TIM-barrel fold metal-dependent hydrolase
MTLPVFATPRLTLRSITAHDADGLHEAFGDADAMRHWDLPPSRDVSQTAERIRMSVEADPRWHGMWAIQTHAGRFVGAINYHAHNEQQRRLALGWIVVPSCWRQGLMTEAAPPVISHCFTRLNAHRIEARIEPENLSSRRLAAKLGFTEEGTLRDWLCVAGEFRSVVMYSLLRAEWMARLETLPFRNVDISKFYPYGDPRPVQQRSRPMLIVDARVHLWNASNPTSPWHRQIPAYLTEHALKEMDAGGVDAAILTPHTPWDPMANELCMEAVRAHPDRFAILGNFPLDKPESRALVDTWRQRPGMLGCRFTFIGPEQSTWPTDGTVDWLWPAAERAGLPIAMMAANFLPTVAEVAQRHPNLKLILDHLGRPRGDTSPSERWANLADVLALAKYPNVAMKATGAASTTPSAPRAGSGAPTSRACRARGVSA